MRYGDYNVKPYGVLQNVFNENKLAQDTVKKETIVVPVGQKKEEQREEPITGLSVERQEQNLQNNIPQSVQISDDDSDSDSDVDTDVDTDETEPKIQSDDDNDDDKDAEDIDSENEDPELKIDHDINTEDRIHTHKSIAIHGETNGVTSKLQDLIFDDVEDNDPVGSNYVRAFKMVRENKGSDIITSVQPGKANIYAKATFEFSKYNMSNEELTVKLNSNAYKLDFGTSWAKEHKNGTVTRIIGYASASKTYDKLEGKIYNANVPEVGGETQDENQADKSLIRRRAAEQTDDVQEPVKGDLPISGNIKSVDYSAFVAAQQTFKNGDALTGSVSYFNDGSEGSTIKMDSKYAIDKLGIYVEGDATIYNGKPQDYEKDTNPNANHRTLVTNVKFGFNNPSETEELSFEPVESEKTFSNETQLDVQSENNQAKDKKWERKSSPYIISNTIAQNYENGIGLDQVFRKRTSDSSLVLGAFGRYTMVIKPKDETTLGYDHSISFGGDLRYKKYYTKSMLSADVKVRDRVAFGQGNIFTAKGLVSYESQKLSAEAEAIYIKVPASTYAGATGRVVYHPNKNINIFAEADIMQMKDGTDNFKGASVQAGIRANF